jgi:hypothetical protein
VYWKRTVLLLKGVSMLCFLHPRLTIFFELGIRRTIRDDERKNIWLDVFLPVDILSYKEL